MKQSVTSKSEKELIQIKVDSMNREIESYSSHNAKLAEEINRLSKEIINKEGHIREQDLAIRDAKHSEEVHTREVRTLEQENSSNRAIISKQQEEIERLNRALTEAHIQRVAYAPPDAPIPPHNNVFHPQNPSSQGIVDLGILVGKQQASVDLLENRLKDADNLISKIRATAEMSSPRAENTERNADPKEHKKVNSEPTTSHEILKKEESEQTNNSTPDDGEKSSTLQMLRTLWKRDNQLRGVHKKERFVLLDGATYEIKFITEARKALRNEKVTLNGSSNSLSRREIWKKQARAIRCGMHCKSTDLTA